MTDKSKRDFEEAWSEFMRIRFPKCCHKSVDGLELALFDSHLAGCVSWYRAVLRDERTDIPPEHRRYLRERLPFLIRLTEDDPDEVCRSYFGLWLNVVKTILSGLPDLPEPDLSMRDMSNRVEN